MHLSSSLLRNCANLLKAVEETVTFYESIQEPIVDGAKISQECGRIRETFEFRFGREWNETELEELIGQLRTCHGVLKKTHMPLTAMGAEDAIEALSVHLHKLRQLTRSADER